MTFINDDGGWAAEISRIRNDYINVRNALKETVEILDRIPYLMIHYQHIRKTLEESLEVHPYRFQEGVLMDGHNDTGGSDGTRKDEGKAQDSQD